MIKIDTALNGSKIKINRLQDSSIEFSWQKPDVGLVKYFFGFFILVWLAGWGFGLKIVFMQIINSPNLNLFLLAWITLWLAGGLAAGYFAYLALRPQIPEKLSLHSDQLNYDSGTVSPLGLLFNMKYMLSPWLFWQKCFRQRIIHTGVKKRKGLFNLEKNPSRIYFDLNSDRIELGNGLREPEIEWLYLQISNWSNQG